MGERMKPLSCFCCERSRIIQPQLSYPHDILLPGNPAVAVCTDIEGRPAFELYTKSPAYNKRRHELWLPYHCGRFMPQMVKIKCQSCNTGCFVMPEWKYAAALMKGVSIFYVCSTGCAQMLAIKVTPGGIHGRR